jgi:transcriptional regulator with XRE-family HTH domain
MDGEELRRIRRDMKISQAELGRRIGMDSMTISRYERGVLRIQTPIARFIRLLARLHRFGISVEGIEELEDDQG